MINRLIITLFVTATAFAGPPLGLVPTAMSEGRQLQATIDAGATFVVVPKATYQLDATLRLASNLTLWCEPGAVLEQAPNSLPSNIDVPEASLVALDGVENVEIHNCIFRGRKQDYQQPGEWNHAIRMAGVTNVRIVGVRCENARGDGIYLGPLVSSAGRKPCKNVTIDRVVCDANHRTGLAVVSAENVAIRDSVFNNTKGTPTQMSLLCEPSHGHDVLINISVERCTASGNGGSAFGVQMIRQTPTSKPVSVTFRDNSATNMPVGVHLFRVENFGFNNFPQKPLGFIRWNDSIWENK